jgi:SAM-dependent methyltransferase
MEPLPLGRLEVLDAGSGLSNRLLDWYRPRVKHAFLVDFLLDSRSEGNTTVVRGDLEQGIPLADASVDLVTSVSSIEHLSRAGQILFLGEAQRVLRPGGLVVMTVSYSLGLDKHKLEVLASNPVLLKAGFSISAALNLRHMLEAAPGLAPPETPVWSSFPGYEGFSEQALFENRDVLLDTVHIDDRLPEAAEVNSLAVRWAEIGIFLTNSPGGISP